MGTRMNMPERKLARQQRAAARFTVMSFADFVAKHCGGNPLSENYQAYVSRVNSAQANLLAKIGA